jgi:hypothetical protein
MKNIQGSAAKKNRRNANSSGGKSPRPILMMAKLVPQTATTVRARSNSVRVMGRRIIPARVRNLLRRPDVYRV